MIIVRLQGGLGNQMFQFATGWSVARHYGLPLHLDVSFYNNPVHEGVTPRSYQLNEWNIDVPLASTDTIRKFRFHQKFSLYRKLSSKIPFIFKNIYFTESFFGYHPEIFRFPAHRTIYLNGYWQSYHYFEKYASDIKLLFSEQINSSESYKNWKSKILQQPSVGLQIRRGDYVSSPSASSFHCLYDEKPYLSILDELANEIKEMNIFVFSDDMEWCKEKFRDFQSVHFIQPLQDMLKNSEEILLMSLCNHLIISNSTFSWWGAWLNERRGKIYCPKQWFKNAEMNTLDLIPKNWLLF